MLMHVDPTSQVFFFENYTFLPVSKLTLQGCHLFLKFSHITPQLEKTPLASSQVQGTIQNWPHYIQNPQPRSTCLPKRINSPLYTSFRNTRRSTHKLNFFHMPTFDRRVHKSIKHFSNSLSHYAPVLWNSFHFQIRNRPTIASFRKHLKTQLFISSFPT